MLTAILAILASLFAFIAFVIDATFVGISRNHIKKDTDGVVTVSFGNAVWMTLAAMICLFIATMLSCVGCVRIGRNPPRQSEKF